jgi:hypothetical protein
MERLPMDMNLFQFIRFNFGGWWIHNVARRLPTLIWWNDELDVTVTFKEAKMPEMTFDPASGFPAEALGYLGQGQLADIERKLGEIGISFDHGGSARGRDWEWDWSLRGPISVRFRSRASKPERRQ